ncbi:unnamed protein product [Penicillium salamii]|nr:unnamed protein product [Penicillium salamii]CAG8429122.1 unnamed protein product [Penicillium salamii]
MVVLSHRTGLATKNALWQQDGPELLLNQNDTVMISSYLEAIEPMRSKWIYNNWGYGLCSIIIEQVSQIPWCTFLKERILDPLGLKNTYTSVDVPHEHHAKGYMPGLDGDFTDVVRPIIGAGTVQQGAKGVKSTVSDLLRYYHEVLSAWKAEINDTPSSSPLKNIRELFVNHIPLDPTSNFPQWYGAGWAVAELPAPLGSIGSNQMFLSDMPLVGKGIREKTPVWYHNGSLIGFFSSVHILPESDIIIVVLVNSTPKNDCADWLGQLLLETLLENTDKNDYVSLANESAAAYAKT